MFLLNAHNYAVLLSTLKTRSAERALASNDSPLGLGFKTEGWGTG